MNVMLTFSHDEIVKNFPYALICETRYGSKWDTGKRRRLFNETFSVDEYSRCRKIFRLAHSWTLTKGVPKEVKMTVGTYNTWKKLGEFCAAL